MALAMILIVYTPIGKSQKISSTNPISLAVVPLDNLSSDEESLFFTEGMQDAIIGALGKVSSLRVISRTSTLKFNSIKMSMKYVADELEVMLLLEGSVYIYGDSARIQFQLIKPDPKEKHLWAGEYYIGIKDFLNIQSNLVQDIAQEIDITITTKEKQQLEVKRTLNIETFKSYLRGMYFINKHSPQNLKKEWIFSMKR